MRTGITFCQLQDPSAENFDLCTKRISGTALIRNIDMDLIRLLGLGQSDWAHRAR